jgi:membrane-associated phospholipid phosphatase
MPVAAPAGAATGLPPPKHLPADVLAGWVRVAYAQVKAERCSPPSAARIYAYLSLASYEAVVAGMPRHRSVGGQVNDLPESPRAAGVQWELAANEAVAVVAQAVFADRTAGARTELAAHADAERSRLSGRVAGPIAAASIDHGRRVGEAIAARSTRDGYLGILGLAYTPPVGPDKWVRTPPNFGAAIEPHWNRVSPFALASNDECKPAPPVPYSESEGSAFWLQAKTVYDTWAALTDSQRTSALFWRDNPDGSTGLPSGHWMLIALTVIEDQAIALDRAAEILLLLGLALADGFTSCWTEKYETNLLRPVTYIQRLIDPSWASFVNSPAFPEYTSGHSVGSGAAAQVLTALLGEVAFTDTVGRQNGYEDSSYRSFWEAAGAAAVSRLYGGIHYPMAIEVGLTQGAAVAAKVLDRVQTRR